jgi:hypothetical protein
MYAIVCYVPEGVIRNTVATRDLVTAGIKPKLGSVRVLMPAIAVPVNVKGEICSTELARGGNTIQLIVTKSPVAIHAIIRHSNS